MLYQIFNIPLPDSDQHTRDLNQFISSHKIVTVTKELVCHENGTFWTFVVEYFQDSKDQSGTKRKNQIDYKEVLAAEDFALYSELRDLRKKLAEEEGVPLYAVFNNEQLAQMASKKVKTKTAMAGIPGVGQSKIDKYSRAVLALLDPDDKVDEKG